MIRINLLPERETLLIARRRKQIRYFLGACLLLAAFIAQKALMTSLEMSRLKVQIVALEKSVVGVEQLKTESLRLGEMKKNLGLRVKTIEELEAKKVGPWMVLEELSARAPNALWLTEINESSGRATLTGLALDHPAIASFLINLGRSSRFGNVDLIEVKEEEKNGTLFKRFSAKADFRY